MMDAIRGILSAQYGLDVQTLRQVAGGWCATAFVAHTDRGRYFVKVYDKHRPSVQPWIARMDLYLPVVRWLSQTTALRDHMAAPILTKNAGLKAQDNDSVILVFPFIDGPTLGETPLTSPQILQLAQILAALHSYGEELPVPTKSLVETNSLPILDSLDEMISSKDLPSSLRNIMRTHGTKIHRATETLRLLAEKKQARPAPYRLCHTDVHGWNLMWSDRLILIDWEGLQLAPVESDLFVFSSGFFFDYGADAFYSSYRKARPAYTVNQTAMHFYRLRRRIQDISEFFDSIACDGLDVADMEQSLICLQQECAALGDVLDH